MDGKLSDSEIMQHVSSLSYSLWFFILKESKNIPIPNWEDVVMNSLVNIIFNVIDTTYPHDGSVTVDDHVEKTIVWLDRHIKTHIDDIKETIKRNKI